MPLSWRFLTRRWTRRWPPCKSCCSPSTQKWCRSPRNSHQRRDPSQQHQLRRWLRVARTWPVANGRGEGHSAMTATVQRATSPAGSSAGGWQPTSALVETGRPAPAPARLHSAPLRCTAASKQAPAAPALAFASPVRAQCGCACTRDNNGINERLGAHTSHRAPSSADAGRQWQLGPPRRI